MKYNTRQTFQLFSSTHTFATAARLQMFVKHTRLAILVVATLLGSSQWLAAQTALDDYINKADASYNFTLNSTSAGDAGSGMPSTQ